MNKLIIMLVLWGAGSKSANSQATLQVFINEQQWNTNSSMSIKPTDTIRIRFVGNPGSLYYFENPKLEIVLRKRTNSKKEKNYRDSININFPNLQEERLRLGPKKMDLNPYCTDINFTNFTATPVITIPCNKFNRQEWMLSRIILHIHTIKEKRGAAVTTVPTTTMGWDRKFFRNGFSFWRGMGFQ